MKVTYVIDSLHGGGAETSAVDQMHALRQLGVETELVTLLPDDGALSARIADLDIRVTRLEALSWRGRVGALRQLIASSGTDVLHTSLTWSDLVGRMAALAIPVPVVSSMVNSSYGPEHRAGSEYGPAAVRALQATDLVTARRVTLFHAISEHVAEVMIRRLWLPRGRVRVIHEGRNDERLGRRTDARRAQARTGLGLTADVPLVIMVGRLDPQKAHEVSIEALRLLRERVPLLQAVIIGRDGGSSEVIRELVEDLPWIRVLGHRTDAPDLMCAADCLCFPSRWEGLGGTLLEALALELPYVATNIGPIVEVTADVGWPLVPVEDPRAVADALETLLSGDQTVKERVAKGRRRFESVFAVDSVAERMLELYMEAIELGARR